ncbi:MAG: hypothetical protein ABSA17_00645 [Rhabdochlamydiaceae bacterium]|jgi:hypothetical protein
MNKHLFIFSPSTWLGEGKIQLNMVEEELPFYTKWNITQKDPEGKIECIQQIQVKGLSEMMHNQLMFSDFATGNFLIELDNPSIGRVTGKGLITDKMIAWEFRVPQIGFEGFETYEKQPDDSYIMHAEYATADQLRTVIKGKVWQESTSKKQS